MDWIEQEKQNQNIDKRAKAVAESYLKSASFKGRNITDVPTDSFSMVNRKFVTLNGVTGSRPPNPTIGQFYFDTTLGYPIWWDGSQFVDATGTPA